MGLKAPLYNSNYLFTQWFEETLKENPVVVAQAEPRKVQLLHEAWEAGYKEGANDE